MKIINPRKSLLRNVLSIAETCHTLSPYQTLAKALCCLIWTNLVDCWQDAIHKQQDNTSIAMLVVIFW